jgi:hypothetical protein
MQRAIEIIKKNLLSIICGVVAIIAVVASFVPISGWFNELRDQAAARAGYFDSLNGLLNKTRNLPIVDPMATEAQPLELFPTERVIDAGKRVVDEVRNQSQDMFKAAIQLNEKPLLLKDALPSPNRRTIFDFVAAYKKYYDILNPDQRVRQEAILWQVARAGMAPSEADYQRARDEIRAQFESQQIYDPTTGQPTNKAQIDQQIAQGQARVTEEMRFRVANSIKCYVGPDAIPIHPQIMNATGEPPLTAIYEAHVAMWVTQDVLAGIANANSRAQSVVDAPVKQLVRLSMGFPLFNAAPQPSQPSEDGGESAPAGVVPDPAAPITPNFAVSPTGRVSNGLYDVFTYDLILHVEADAIPQVLRDMSSNRLFTVLNVDIFPVDSAQMLNAGYVYGPKQILALNMRCESLLLRGWTLRYMPAGVKTALGIADPQPTPPPQ